ncbi:unnamed protein product, partial [Didymodactylos carnosus]
MKRKNDIKTWSTFIEEMQKEYSVEEKQSQATDGQRKRQPHIYHQQHLQRVYDHYSVETIVLEKLTAVMDTEELEWPKQGESWADYEIKQQRERFRKITTNECDILNELVNSGPQLSTTSEEGEEEEEGEKVEEVFEENEEQGAELEVNDDRQPQLHNSVIRLMDDARTLLLSKLYGVIEHLQVNRRVKPFLSSVPLFQFALSRSGISSDPITSFH